MVQVGTPVRLIDQPVKVGQMNGVLFLESHEPLEEDNIPIKVTLEQAQRAVIAKTGPDMPGVDQAALEVAVEQISGIPVSISAAPGTYPTGQTASTPPSYGYPVEDEAPTPSIPPRRYAPPYVNPAPGYTPAYSPPTYPNPAEPPPVYRPYPLNPAPYPRSAAPRPDPAAANRL
jgi:L,D-transpeptidase ErfK/SrfK